MASSALFRIKSFRLVAILVLICIFLAPSVAEADHGSNAPLFYPLLHPITGTVTELVDSIVEGKEHDGYDIQGYDENPGSTATAKARGGRVYASWFGVVTVAGWSGEYGYMVEIEHRNGYRTRYAHLASGTITVSVGQYVTPMQQIGTEGTTGDSSGVHLHFEILKDGDFVNANAHIKDNQRATAGAPLTFGSNWELHNGDTQLPGLWSFIYGSTNPYISDIPLAGDWNCDDLEEPALVRVNLSSSNPNYGKLEWRFNDNYDNTTWKGPIVAGSRGDIPIVGDWDGDGCDDPGVRKANSKTWVLMKLNASAGTMTTWKTHTWNAALTTDWPLAGDWRDPGKRGAQSCGQAALGVTRIDPSTGSPKWSFDYNFDGVTDRSFLLGVRGDQPLVGHWTHSCLHGIGVARQNATTNQHEWHLAYDLTPLTGQTSPDINRTFIWGGANDYSFAINWDQGDGDTYSDFGRVD